MGTKKPDAKAGKGSPKTAKKRAKKDPVPDPKAIAQGAADAAQEHADDFFDRLGSVLDTRAEDLAAKVGADTVLSRAAHWGTVLQAGAFMRAVALQQKEENDTEKTRAQLVDIDAVLAHASGQFMTYALTLAQDGANAGS